MTGEVRATYAAKCSSCGDDIKPGEMIKFLRQEDGDFEDGDWVHLECWEDENDSR